MVCFYTEHFANFGAPAMLAVSYIIKHCSEGGISRHYKFACHTAHKILLNIKPFMYLCEIFGLVCLYPFVFPHGVLNACGNGTCNLQTAEKLGNICACNLRSVSKSAFKLCACSLVHIAERTANMVTVFINKHKPLHLRTEGNTVNLCGVYL